ncbi:HAD-like domain-containing protein [Endogone sp. FLAS-F59071]|nr:HAD-like domain-containing protein [Endogone sp. FLAS-F59071]|eukprot:RUS16868.1 HAD-like domain-containing protein [Endogone sp. FLAS-F59071]
MATLAARLRTIPPPRWLHSLPATRTSRTTLLPSTYLRIIPHQPAASRTFATDADAASQARSLAADALAQRIGNAPRTTPSGSGSMPTGHRTTPTAPKGSKKPSKAPGQGDSKWKAWTIGIGTVTGLMGSGFAFLGRPFTDGREDKYTEENLALAAFHRARDRYRDFQDSLTNPMWDKILPPPLPEPYQRPFTLVINLDETLIYSTWDKEHGWRHAKRPGVDYFLAYLSQFYELVIFTSQSFMNAGPIVDKLDPYQYVMYRVYREACRQVDGKLVKDLSHLNRDLARVIIMDSNPDAYALQPENAVPLKPWKGEPEDKGLLEYVPFLEAIALTNVEDVRPVLKSFSDTDIPKEWAHREKLMNDMIRKQWEEEQAQRRSKRSLMSLLSHTTEEQGPPPSFLDQARKQYREQFANEHDDMKKMAEEQLKQSVEEQQRQMREMKMTVWQLMSTVSQGQPLLPPPGQSGKQA